jgi:hypothetical protein
MKHIFSIELKSKQFIKTISVSEDPRNLVYFEGFLGDIEEFDLVNGGLLEIKGVNGVFRLDVSEEELKSFKFIKRDASAAEIR